MMRTHGRRGEWVSRLRALLLSGAALAVPGCSDGDDDSGAEADAVTSSGVSTDSDSDGGSSSSGSSSGDGSMSEATSSSTDDTGEPAPRAITWHQDIAPIVAKKCSGCHESGGITRRSTASSISAANGAAAA